MTYRTIVEDARFLSELQGLETNPHRADEIVDGAKWVLSRDPYHGVQLAPRSDVWFLPILLPGSGVSLYYTFDDKTVRFLSIRQRRRDG